MLRTLITSLALAAALLQGCSGDGNKDLSAGVVHNPNSADGKADKSAMPVITFETSEHDFGKILEGESVSVDFTFTNTGKTDLLIGDVSTSCGCAVPSFTRAPVRPGDKGTIKVAFNSQGQRGYQIKNVLVVSNTQPNTTVLKIKARVVNPAAEN